jgi:GNAT superfamily N-acetyltransferase
MKIRKAQPKDAADIRALIISAHESNRAEDFNTLGWEKSLCRNEAAAIKDRIRNGNYLMLCCLLEARIIGVIGIYNNDSVYYLFVNPAHRGKGVASRLWQLAKKLCPSRAVVERFWVRSSTLALPV